MHRTSLGHSILIVTTSFIYLFIWRGNLLSLLLPNKNNTKGDLGKIRSKRFSHKNITNMLEFLQQIINVDIYICIG